MSTTLGSYTADFVMTLADARAFAEIVCIVTLVVLLLQREMVHHRPQMWARAGSSALSAAILPLALAWLVITAQRFADLLT